MSVHNHIPIMGMPMEKHGETIWSIDELTSHKLLPRGEHTNDLFWMFELLSRTYLWGIFQYRNISVTPLHWSIELNHETQILSKHGIRQTHPLSCSFRYSNDTFISFFLFYNELHLWTCPWWTPFNKQSLTYISFNTVPNCGTHHRFWI